MSAAIYDFTIEKGVDFSMNLTLQRVNGDYVDLSNSGVYVVGDIVEFYELPPVTSFSFEEILPSGAKMTLTEAQTRLLPYEKCYYDVILYATGDTERLLQGVITTSEQATYV